MRLRTIGILIALALLATAIVAGPASAGQTSVKQLKKELRAAKKYRQRARERERRAGANLAGARVLFAATNPDETGSTLPAPATSDLTPPPEMDQALATVLLADGVVTADEIVALKSRVSAAHRLAHRWNLKVKRLQKRVNRLVKIAEWSRRGVWRPLIEIAGHKYGVSPAGLHRLMILESGGSRTAGTMYKGLFQYYPSTWSGSWNPWRHESIFDGWAQIRATAYALSKGMGPSQWPNTYPMAF